MAEIYKEFTVPDPIIEMPKLKEDVLVTDATTEQSNNGMLQYNKEAYNKYLDYLHFLVIKHGDDWRKSLSDEEKRKYVLSYYDAHPDVDEEEVVRSFK